MTRPDTLLEDGSRIHASPATLSKYHLDEYGITYGILNAGGLQLGLSPEPDFAATMVSAINDVFVNEWLPSDERLRYSLIVSPGDPNLAAKEIHRLGDRPGVVQVIMCNGARMPYGERYCRPIYQAAAEHDLPVAIHPGSEGLGMSGAPHRRAIPPAILNGTQDWWAATWRT